MRLRARYLLSLLALVAIMTGPAIHGVSRVHDLRVIALDLRHEAAETAISAGRLSRAVAELDRHQRAYVATAEPGMLEHVSASIDRIEEQVWVLEAHGYGEQLGGGAGVALLRQFADSLSALVEKGNLEAATGHVTQAGRPLLARADQAILDLSDAIDRKTAARAADAERLAATAMNAMKVAILLALALAVILAWLASRLLTRPLERLSRTMAQVAEGHPELPVDAATERDDEIGGLFRSLHTMAARLQESDRVRGHFLGVASHDLKTPISVIIGYAELLEEAGGDLDPRHRRILLSLQEQARLLGERVDQFDEISRMEARDLRLGAEEIHIRHFANDLEKALAPIAHGQGVDLVVSVRSSAPTFIVADPDCLRSQIIGNMVAHSIKFSPPNGVVHVEFGGQGGRCVIEVRDQGPRVPDELVDRLFDRYFTGASPGGRVGSGVALPVAHAVAQAHGGSITVRSDASGSSFTIDLPLRPPVEASAGDWSLTSAPSPAPAAGTR